MTMMNQRFKVLGALLAGLFLIGACADLQEPAQKALSNVDAAAAAISADAQKYTPTEYATLTKKISELRAIYDKKDYQIVIDTAPKAIAAVHALGDIAAAKKKEALDSLNAAWSKESSALPQEIAAVDKRLAEMKKSRQKSIPKEAIADAQTALDDAKKAWADAQSAATAGAMEDAVDKAKDVHTKLADIRKSLGMPSPDLVAK